MTIAKPEPIPYFYCSNANYKCDYRVNSFFICYHLISIIVALKNSFTYIDLSRKSLYGRQAVYIPIGRGLFEYIVSRKEQGCSLLMEK